MGDKSTAKSTMLNVGVPTVPGSKGLLANWEEAASLASEMGYPVMIKATAGGGGRGMRLVNSPESIEELFKAAQGESEAAFGNAGFSIVLVVLEELAGCLSKDNPIFVAFGLFSLAQRNPTSEPGSSGFANCR